MIEREPDVPGCWNLAGIDTGQLFLHCPLGSDGSIVSCDAAIDYLVGSFGTIDFKAVNFHSAK
jgi:hypothetical protein